MKTFTIENETNNITIYASAKEAEAVPDSECFGSEAALSTLAADWPAAGLIEIWNSLPGTTPVKKFKDRATAVSRIWKALQTLDEAERFAGCSAGEYSITRVGSDVRPKRFTESSAQNHPRRRPLHRPPLPVANPTQPPEHQPSNPEDRAGRRV